MLKGRKKETLLWQKSLLYFSQENTTKGIVVILTELTQSAVASAKGDYGYRGKQPISFKLVNNAKVQFMCYKGKEIT